MRRKQICILAAVDAVALGGLGAFTQTAHADTVVLNIVTNTTNSTYRVYLDDKTGDSLLASSAAAVWPLAPQ